MTVGRPVVERRGADRPSNGDTALCPQCQTARVEFNERYRLPSPRGILISTPAWICENASCGYHKPVRKAQAATTPRKSVARKGR